MTRTIDVVIVHHVIHPIIHPVVVITVDHPFLLGRRSHKYSTVIVMTLILALHAMKLRQEHLTLLNRRQLSMIRQRGYFLLQVFLDLLLQLEREDGDLFLNVGDLPVVF